MSAFEQFIKKAGVPPNSPFVQPTGFNPWWMLPFIRTGWKWELKGYGALADYFGGTDTTQILLEKGGVAWKFPFEKITRQRWFTHIMFAFDNPYGQLDFQIDDFRFKMSPALLSIFPLMTGNWSFKMTGAAPMSAFGPIYPLMIDPVMPLPAQSDVRLELSNPSSSPATRIEALLAAVGYVVITDYEEFLDELQKASAEFGFGQELKKWIRRK